MLFGSPVCCGGLEALLAIAVCNVMNTHGSLKFHKLGCTNIIAISWDDNRSLLIQIRLCLKLSYK